MNRKTTHIDLEAALEKTVPSAEFDAAGTRRELSATQQEHATPGDAGHYLERTAEDHTPTSASDTSGLEGFGESTEVPPQLRTRPYVHEPRFEVKRELGRGGNAMVFEVHDHSLGRTIALKLLHQAAAARKGRQQRFIHEARVTAMLEHPNIVPVYDIGVTPRERVYFLMKNVGGTSLGDAIRAMRTGAEGHESLRTIDGKLRVFLKLCDAMEYAHARGFIHQDIKPDNVMLGGYGEVLVMDWGCALSSEETESTGHRPVFGTPAYMSPEQARRERSDERSDIYCMGATLYHLLTLQHPTWAEDAERFWEMKREGELSPLPPEAEQSIPVLLMAIVRRAMAPDAAERYQSVAEFRQAIEQYQTNAASIALVEEARQTLATAREHRSYEEFRRCLYSLEQALRLWPENPAAAEVLSEARQAFAWCALERGDIELAAETIEPEGEDGGVRGAIAAAREAQRRRRRTLRLMKVSVVLLSLMVIAVSAYAAYQYFLQFGRWHPVYQMDFTKQGADLTGLSFCQYDMLQDSVRDSCGPSGIRLSFSEDAKESNMFWLRDVHAPGNVQVRLKVTWPETIDGLEIHFNAHRERMLWGWYHPPGFSGQFGGYGGDINFLSRNDVAQPANPSSAVKASFEPGRIYELQMQRIGEEVSLWVDGRRVLQLTEVLPLAGKGLDMVAIRAWGTILIKELTVSRLTLPQRASPLLAGDALVREGAFMGSVERYLEVARDYPGTRLEEEALARAYFAAAQAGLPADSLAGLRYRFDRRFPNSELRLVVHEAEAVSLWRRDEWTDALDLAEGVVRTSPESRVALRLISVKHRPLPTDVATRLLELLARTEDVGRLTLVEYDFTDISPLAGMPLRSLEIRDNRITSLAPLASMQLRSLSCGGNDISDLSPLRGMPLGRLQANSNRITDLSPLAGMPLRSLDLDDNRISSLEPLRGMRLRSLKLTSNPVVSLEPLRGMAIEDLVLTGTDIEDLSPLVGMPLRSLNASCTNVRDLSPAARMSLRNLRVQGCPVRDLSPLAGTSLRSLTCSETHVKDLSPLSDVPLRRLAISHTEVVDLQPLTHITTLNTLAIDSTQVSDLRPLAHLSLTALTAIGAPLSSLEPFETAPPEKFVFDTPTLSDAYLEPLLTTWERDSSLGHTVRRVRALRAVRTGHSETLRAIASSFEGRVYLYLPLALDFEAARELAERFGAHLVTIASQAEQNFVCSTVLGPDGNGIWLGLQSANNRLRWVTGEPVGFTSFYSPVGILAPPPHYLVRTGSGAAWFNRNERRATWRMRVVLEWEE